MISAISSQVESRVWTVPVQHRVHSDTVTLREGREQAKAGSEHERHSF